MEAAAGNNMELRVPSRPEYVPVIRVMVTDLAQPFALSHSAVEDVQVAISEARANVVGHAHPGGDPGPAEMHVRDFADAVQIAVEVAERVCGFRDLHASKEPGGGNSGAFGLILIRGLVDRVQWSSSRACGTTIRTVKFAARSSSSQPADV